MSDDRPIRSAEEAAYRALVLGAYVLRGLLERHHQMDRGVLSRRTDRTGMRGLKVWMELSGLTDHQSSQEREHFDREPGTWDAEAISAASWRVEGLGVLMWALGLQETILPYDALFDSGALLEPIPFYDEIDEFLQRPLRPADVLRKAREAAEVWRWRARAARLQQHEIQGDLDEIIADLARRSHAASAIPPPIQNDFPAFGTHFGALDDGQYAQIAAASAERHLALNWLCGFGDDWDSTPTHT